MADNVTHRKVVVAVDDPGKEVSTSEWNDTHATPDTTKGDLLARNATALTRLPVGTNTHVLTADSAEATGLKWAAAASPTPDTTKGDLLVRNATVLTRLPVGTNAQVLTADSAEATGVKWAAASGGGSSVFRGVRLYRTAGQTVTTAVVTNVNFDAENFDTDFYHDNVTNNTRITIPAGLSGKYRLHGVVAYTADSTAPQARIVKNNVDILALSTPGGGTALVDSHVMVDADLVAGDYVELRAYHNSGTDRTLDSLTHRTAFEATVLSGPGTPDFSGAEAYASAAQSITNNTVTVLALNTERYDTDAYHDNVTNNTRMTIPADKAGKYLITAFLTFAASAAGTERDIQIKLNGTTKLAAATIGPRAVNQDMSVTWVRELAAGDYVEVFAFQDSGGALNASAGECSVTRLGSGGGGGASWIQDVNESGASFANFTAASGTWDSNGTVIRQTDTTATSRRAKFNTMLPLGLGVIFEAEVNVISGVGANRQSGLLIGFDGTLDSGFSVKEDSEANNISIEQGSVLQSRAITVAFVENTWYKLRVIVGGELMTVYLDGVLQGSVHMANIALRVSADFIGIESYGAVSHFRNIKAWTLRGGIPS